jgi:Fic family protein
MPWSWQLPEWPKFSYDPGAIAALEKQFLVNLGSSAAFIKTLDAQEHHQFIVEMMSIEGEESAKIEGEILDRSSLQSSIKKQFGLNTPLKRETRKEADMAKLLYDVYNTFDKPLDHATLWSWHSILFDHSSKVEERGGYRTHPEPMQIVSGRYDDQTVFFEAPPSSRIFKEMEKFVAWFNSSTEAHSILARAAVVHLYFETIHPFEDGNGRIGRALVEKVLSQGAGKPILIALSNILEKRRKEYYQALEKCNCSLQIDEWLKFFGNAIVEAQQEAMKLLHFLIGKAKLLTRLAGQLNSRQEKTLLRIFAEGPSGFKGGLSAENYIAITKTTRSTATRDLADLVEKGALFKTGELRHTRYWPNL